MRPAKLDFQGGSLEVDLELDLVEAPFLSLDVDGRNLDPWTSLQLEQDDEDIQGRVDLAVHLETRGTGPRELAKNAEGSLHLEARNGRVRTTMLRFLFADVIGWATDLTTGNRYEQIECAAADLGIENGVISGQKMFIESKSFGVTGQGTVDLLEEQVDVVFLPRRKSSLFKSVTPVNIKGPLRNPSVSTIPWKVAATAYGGYALAPVYLGLSVTRKITGDLLKKPASLCDEFLAHKADGPEP